jgi:hypothetical protein
MGSRVTRAAAHLPAEDVKRRMTHDPRFWCRQRWLIIYQALIAPRKAEEIATHTGASLTTVRRVISTYNRFGVAAVETPGTGGRRHEYLTMEQERAFLLPFFARAAVGEIATVAEIQRAFEAAIQPERSPEEHLSPLTPPWLAQARPTLLPSAGQRRRSKPRLKKLRRERPSGGRHACPRRSAPRVKDGGG